jgi:hypothetical protein
MLVGLDCAELYPHYSLMDKELVDDNDVVDIPEDIIKRYQAALKEFGEARSVLHEAIKIYERRKTSNKR